MLVMTILDSTTVRSPFVEIEFTLTTVELLYIIICIRRLDLEIDRIEYIWLKLTLKQNMSFLVPSIDHQISQLLYWMILEIR